MIDRHRDEDQICECRRAAAHHNKKVIPLIGHLGTLAHSSDSRQSRQMSQRIKSVRAPWFSFADLWLKVLAF
jgi:hypothetical protein